MHRALKDCTNLWECSIRQNNIVIVHKVKMSSEQSDRCRTTELAPSGEHCRQSNQINRSTHDVRFLSVDFVDFVGRSRPTKID